MNPPPNPPLEVVCALIESNSPDNSEKCLLAAQRSSGHLQGKWEFPGGKVESNELPSEALRREIKEELGCDITILETFPHVDFDYGNGKPIRLMPFLCTTKDTPIPSEHAAVTQVTIETCDSLDWAEADLPILDYWKKRRLLLS